LLFDTGFCKILITSISIEGETGKVSRTHIFSFIKISRKLFPIFMAAKKVKTIVKLNLPAGTATPAPPVGPALGQHGIAIMEFIKAYNDRTAKLKGQVIPAVITIFEDRTFTFITKLPPVAAMIKKTLSIEKGSGKPSKESAGKLTKTQIETIAKEKMPDLNTEDLEQAKLVVAGTARSLGMEVES
jgi:large subunit ribosomal protein L11